MNSLYLTNQPIAEKMIKLLKGIDAKKYIEQKGDEINWKKIVKMHH